MTTDTATTSSSEPVVHMLQDWATKEQKESGHRHVLGQKCEACAVEPVRWEFAGGATSFADVDRYNEAAAVQGAVDGEMYVFNAILDNIRSNEELNAREKASAIVQAATELEARLDRARARAEAQGERSLADATTDDPGFATAFKDNNGEWRWLAVHSNKYADREGEIFSDAAHKEYADYVWQSKEFPTLRLWHMPINIGKADWLDYDSNGFMVSSGTFLPGFEHAAEQLAQRKDLGCSHGYIYPRSQKQAGVYGKYRTYEISVLPRSRVANTLTAFVAGEEMPMLTPERKEFIAPIVGEDKLEMFETNLGRIKALADEAGLSYKDMEEAIMEQGVKDDVTAVAPAPAAAATVEAPAPAAAAAAPAAEVAAVTSAAPAEGAAPPANSATPPGTGEPEQPSAEDEAAAQQAAAAAAAIAEPPAATDESEMVKGLKAAFAEVLSPVQAELQTLRDEVAALKQSDDAKIAARIAPRVGPIGNGVPASQSPANIVEPPPGTPGSKELPSGPEIVGSGITAAEPYVKMLGQMQNGLIPATP